jgi:hypothetical protein
MIAHNLHTQSIDFKNAFVQSHLPNPIYLEVPPGPFRNESKLQGKILQVNKSLYGDRRAPRLWYDHLRKALLSEKFGMAVSKKDPCLFLGNGVVMGLYVDDAIICGTDQSKVEDLICKLERESFDLTREGDLSAYLGIKIEVSNGGDLKLSQPGLTKRVIDVLGLSNGTSRPTPCEAPLGKCPEAEPMSGQLNYRSILGMMMYLGTNTRPDCAFAINQCARFSNDPRLPHETALKRIGRYLLGTKTDGIFIKRTKETIMDCYVDADFAGLWGQEDVQDPTCVRSRTGFVITLGNMPVIWKSKLQTEIAVCTQEAEYIALSTAMRVLVPLRETLGELSNALRLPTTKESEISTVFEDNQAAIILASTDPPRMTPRSKHIAVKYHWFRSHLKKGEIVITHVGTDDQLADILTKPLTRNKFESARKKIIGW